MTWLLFYHPDVEADIVHAKQWYKRQKPGLEKRFATEVTTALNKIQDAPFHYQIRYREIRIKHLDIFPYGIHFYINSDNHTVVIIGVLHHHQDPNTLYSR